MCWDLVFFFNLHDCFDLVVMVLGFVCVFVFWGFFFFNFAYLFLAEARAFEVESRKS